MERIVIDTRFNEEDFEEWKKEEIECFGEDAFTEEELLERYNSTNYDESLCDLNKKIPNGVIVAFADLGFWDGRQNGFISYGDKISGIINTKGCDDIKIYGKNKQILGDFYHHDGTHHLTFRIAPSIKCSEKMSAMAIRGEITKEYVMKHTKSLYPHIAEIWGWD